MADADLPISSPPSQSQEIPSDEVLAGSSVQAAEGSSSNSPPESASSPLHSDDLASASSAPNDVQQDQEHPQQEDGQAMTAESPDASASDVNHNEQGQVPSLPEKTVASSPETPSATMSSVATPTVATSTEKEKDGESSLATATLSMPFRKRTRRKDDPSTSNGKYAASSTGQPSALSVTVKGPPTKKSRTSLFTKISHIFTSCVSTSHRTHVVDVDEGPSHTIHQNDSEKASHKDAEVTKEASSREPSAPSTVITSPPKLTVVTPPSTLSDSDIVVPPTPTKQLLPLSETDGLTSGAVQPPGSTGDEGKTEHSPHSESGDESDASYSDDDMLMAGEDDEERLIRQGGAGIPIGLNGVPKPLLPPIEPKYAGRKCLVLDLDETLVHSSLKPVPSPDFIVPVEIEYNWHNFYVLKRPGVDTFLKKMGDIYEVVVFTASLSKYADPVLDRLDPDHSVAHRLFRESCYNHRGNYVKDLSQLGRPIGNTIILDNSPASYIFHPHNAVPVSSWFSDVHDTELGDMAPFLADLCHAGDVRGILNPGLPDKN
ncbi:hypothetical protein EUX98_g888 [Antrodiella citrinella]|uniref:FCP1 homology domain-containing protein n=1 Tax=Antrodiella citrinella TaxID=2447956 RepID=A0A4S4N2Q7_9APHY|nr:hypothetical protein EUX98_g888 [Antrodiella citrinella]